MDSVARIQFVVGLDGQGSVPSSIVFLGVLTILLKVTIRFVMSVCLPPCLGTTLLPLMDFLES